MFIILNDKNEFYAHTDNGVEFTTDFAKADTFSDYGDAYIIYKNLCESGISAKIDCI